MSIDGLSLLARVVGSGGLGDYIPAAQVDSRTANLLTSALWLGNANWGSNQFASNEKLIFIPGVATQADQVRYVSSGDHSVSAVVPDRAWSDTNDLPLFMLGGGIHPQWLVDAMNRAMEKCFTENSEPLSIALDAGFQSSLTTFWVESDADGGPTCTFSKEATAGSLNVFSGNGSGRVVNTQTGGYIRQRFYVHPGQIVHLAALCRVSLGQAALVLWDTTNNVEILSDTNGATMTFSGAQWGYISGSFTAPTGCNTVEVRLRGETSSSDIYWGGCWVLRATDKRLDLASTWDSENRIPSLAAATFGYQLQGSQYVASAHSLDLVEIPPSSYGFMFEKAGAHKQTVQFHNESDLFSKGKAIYIQGRRAFSDFTTFTLGLTETTDCDINLIESASRIEAFLDPRIASRVTDPDTRLADAYGAFIAAKGEQQQRGPAKRTPVYFFRGLSN